MHTRQIISMNDTGTAVFTTGGINGRLQAMRYSADAGDTGAEIAVTLLPTKDDTGDGHLFYTRTAMGVDWYDDTGVRDIPLAGDRLQVKLTQATTTATAGRLFIYVDEGGK